MKTLKELVVEVGNIATCTDRKLLRQLERELGYVIDSYSEKLYELYKFKFEPENMAPVHRKKLYSYYDIRRALWRRMDILAESEE